MSTQQHLEGARPHTQPRENRTFTSLAPSPRKRIERFGRRMLMAAWARFFGAKPKPLNIPPAPRILVVRLDERLGNLLLLTPVLRALRRRYPAARIDVLAHAKGCAVLARHPAISHVLPFRKRAIFAPDGPLRTPSRLRQQRYDVCIDMANPRDPSLTQAMLCALSGAPNTLGSAHPSVARFYTHPLTISDDVHHEVDMRLEIIAPLLDAPLHPAARRLSVGALPLPATSPVADYLAALPRPFAVVNLGARLVDKHLSAADYAAVAQALRSRGLTPVLTWGPQEGALAQATRAQAPHVRVAPPTNVPELAALMRDAHCVVTCDTGPMHLAVATGTPTCGVFVSTEPRRFGHHNAPHAVIDARGRGLAEWLPALEQWLALGAA